MNHKSRSALSGVLAGAIALSALFAAAQNAVGPTAGKTSDQAFKNIQMLKGIPADQLIPSMQFISASLGVECEYCHVAGAFDKDDKKPKQTARKMMEMMFAINKGNFEGHREVTCYSCHHGETHPVGIPIIPAGANTTAHLEPMRPGDAKGTQAADVGADARAVVDPEVDPVLDKYVAALGGAAAIQKVTTRVEKGSADLGGRTFPVDIYAQAPDKRVSVMHLPDGDSLTAYNGTVGWLSAPGHPIQWMSQAEADAARLDAELDLPLRMKDIFTDFRLLAPQRIDGREASVVQGLREGKPPVNFYFDQQSGLLVRLVRYADTPLGLNPTQIDYADYRDSGGVKIPYRWTIARPSGQFTIQIEQVQQNVPIAKEKFAQPAPQALEQKPDSH
jgi:photosynthetic reaction center cytochrome c subunit